MNNLLPTETDNIVCLLSVWENEHRCTESLFFCSETFFCYAEKGNKYKFSNKGKKTDFEDCGIEELSKYRKVLHESNNVTSTKN